MRDIQLFFGHEGITLFVTQCNQLLSTLTLNNIDMFDVSKNLVNYVFDCFMPEMQEEVVRRKQKSSHEKDSNKDEQTGEISKYVQMESLLPLAIKPQENENKSSLVLSGPQSSVPGSKQGKSLVFRDIDEASDRLAMFNSFCVQHKAFLNKLVKHIFSSKEKDSSKDSGTVAEYIRYMPNLLDFENKRMYFKKELKRIKRASYSRDITLYIRRN